MVSTPSALLRLNEQAAGDNLNTWGTVLNGQVFDLLEQAIHGYASVAVTSTAQSLTAANYIADQGRLKAIEFTGALTGNTTITIPSVSHDYLIKNSTTGSFTLTVKMATGTGAIVRQGFGWFLVLCDGTNANVSDLPLDKIAAPVAAVSFASQLASNLADPVSAQDAATRGWTLLRPLSAFATAIANIAMGGFKFTGLVDGSPNSQDSATVQQVQTLITAAVIPAGNGMVRASVTDTTNGFLGAKLLGSTVKNTGGNEQVITPGPDLFLMQQGYT